MSTPPEHPLVPPSQPSQAPPAYPYAAPTSTSTPTQQWSQQPPPGAAYSGWAQPQPSTPQDPDATLRKARTALGWAIGAAVGAGLAVLISLAALVLGGFGALGGSDYYYETLRGQIANLPDGGALSGYSMEEALYGEFDEYGIEADIDCPDTDKVTASTVIVCNGEVDGFEWTGVVVFEDIVGSFAVVEL